MIALINSLQVVYVKKGTKSKINLYKLHGGNMKPDIVATISDEVEAVSPLYATYKSSQATGQTYGMLTRSPNTATGRI